MYVGLASQSLAKRLYFYRNPGTSQSTNIRLNGLLVDRLAAGTVSIYVATPPDFDWNGLMVRGAEGLESGLIAAFDLPWNKRGSSATPVMAPSEHQAARLPTTSVARGGLAQRVHDLVIERPALPKRKSLGESSASKALNKRSIPSAEISLLDV
jgi:hypothetical protein